jgi:hypothetical protein
MKQKRIVVPTKGVESWRELLAAPEKHWKENHSAQGAAYTWEAANGVPEEILQVFKGSDSDAFRDASLAIAIPEYTVDLAGGSRPSQNDVFALLSGPDGLIAMMVEAKATEDFDVTLGEWKQRTSEAGGTARLGDIVTHLGLDGLIPDTIRYQLLHRTASSVIEAKRFHAPYAVMLIQSFEADDVRNHYGDFCDFVALYGRDAEKGSLIELAKPQGVRLFAAWVQSSRPQAT